MNHIAQLQSRWNSYECNGGIGDNTFSYTYSSDFGLVRLELLFLDIGKINVFLDT